jgi:cell division septation protein DedD
VISPRFTVGLRAWRPASLALGLVLLAGCAGRAPTPTGGRSLPADSAAMLARALERARPAFRTQEEALRSGVYQPPARVYAADSPAEPPRAAPSAERLAAERAAQPSAPPSTPPSTPPAAPSQPPLEARPIPLPAARPDETTPSGSLEYVVQVAAFREVISAARALGEARRVLPDLPARVDEQDGLFRVSIGSWQTDSDAQRRLDEIRALFPSAWVRPRTVP